MAGVASPDVPAVYCYLLVVLVGLFVSRAYVNERLKDYPDRWAFLSAWVLFLAYWTIPPLLFWFLDYTGAILDTSLLAAALVALGYRQLFSGGVQGVSIPGQAAALWKPFQAWVDKVAERINDRQGRYIDRFAELLRGDVLRDAQKLADLETLALQRTRRLDVFRGEIAAAKSIPEKPVAQSRLFDRLWPELKTSAPNEYGYLLHRQGLVRLGRRWWWLERGRAKTFTGIVLLVVVLLGATGWVLAVRDPRGATFRERIEQRYYQWRFLKANATERDRWRAREYYARELHLAAAGPLVLPSAARTQVGRALEGVAGGRQTLAAAKSDDEKARATATLAAAEAQAQAALQAERLAVRTDGLVRPLMLELRYPEITPRQLDEITRLVMSHHAPALDLYYLPGLIEGLKTSNEVVRLNVHKTLLALQKADFADTPVDGRLVKWEPRKSDSPEHIDESVRLWLKWLGAATARSS
jgi:hypothetical protein